MLSVYTNEGFIPINNRQNYYYSMQYSGFHQLYFDVSVKDSINKYLINEAIIQNEDNRFLIKGINRRTKNVTFTCELDMDDWKETVFKDTGNDEKFKTKTLEEILNAIKPENWVIRNANIKSIRRTPELTDSTPYDVLVSLEELFNIVFDINVIKEEITVINPESFVYDGLYLTPELNMTGITWNGSSSNFCTKLFAYGKTDDDGNTINISSVNNGKEYIEDHTYSNRIVTLVWRDERYTDPQSLFDDARKKMDELCIPKMSYDVLINDLARVNKDYDFLQFGLYKLVKAMIDENVSVVQKVVSYNRYYDNEEKNVVTLSNESQKLTSQVSSLLGGSINQTVDGSLLDQAKKEATFLINQFASKGYKYETENEIYFLDKLPKEDAKYVMIMNLGGIAFSVNGWSGPYLTAWTIDGKFNADFVTTGTLNAVRVKTGILSDKSGNNYWNLDTGDFKLTSSAKIDEKTLEDYVDDISKDAVTTYDKSLTQQQIFNRLTNNGQLQGIYQENGILYVNAEYIKSGVLQGIKVIANQGNIGGFDINNTGFTKTTVTTLKKTYTSADVTRVKSIIDGSITPTSSDINYYDVDGDGAIHAADYIRIKDLYVPCAGTTLYTDVVINSYPFDTKNINKPMITVRYRGTNGNIIAESYLSARTLSTLYVQATGITSGYLNVDTLHTTYGDTTNDFGNKSEFTCYNDESFVGGIIYAGYFADTPNFYILAENGGYLTLGTLGNRWYFQDVDDTNWNSAFYSRDTGSALGKTSKPWYRLYAENSTNVTSDRRVKCDFRNMDERYIEFVEYLMPQLYHRIGHENLPLESGFVAQDVEQAMIKAGISKDELGLVEHYINEKEGIDRYSLVYEGFISILFYYVQNKNKVLDEVSKDLKKLKKILEEKGVI